MSCLIRRTYQHLIRKTLPACPSSFSVLKNTLILSRTYAEAPKKTAKISGGASGGRIKEFPVETDTRRLQEFCCGSNINKEGEDVKLKPESEYPEWLFTLHTSGPKTLEELEPNSKEYWEEVRKLARKRKNQLHRFRVKIMKQF